MQILGVIVEAYATMLSIISAFFVFLIQYYENRTKKIEKEKPRTTAERTMKGLEKIRTLVEFMVTFASFSLFFFYCFSIIASSLFLMLFIGESILKGEAITYALVVILIFAAGGFLFLFKVISDTIRILGNIYF